MSKNHTSLALMSALLATNALIGVARPPEPKLDEPPKPDSDEKPRMSQEQQRRIRQRERNEAKRSKKESREGDDQ